MSDPFFLCSSTWSKTIFLIFKFSTTTSIVQSQSAMSFILSSKFPSVTLLANFLSYKEAGFVFNVVVKELFTILFLTIGLSRVNPFAFSASLSALGTMSSSNTSTPILAKWHAIREPMIPEPRMATFFMALFICVLK